MSEREPVEPDWREAFRGCMTRVMFELKLTRAMLELLCATADNAHWDRRAFGGLNYPDNWISTERALTKRGLIYRTPPRPVRKDGHIEIPWALTPVGVSVVEMLKVGGLFIEAEEAAKKFVARKGRK